MSTRLPPPATRLLKLELLASGIVLIVTEDIFKMWTQSLEDPDAFITYLKGIHLTIKFTVQSLLHIHSLFGTSAPSMAKSLMTFTQNLLPNINSYNTIPAMPPYSLNVPFLSV